MADAWSGGTPGMDGPAENAAAITPADGSDLSQFTKAIYVGGAGAVKVDLVGGTTVTFAAVPVGTWLRVRAKRVYATGTTATNLLGIY